MIEVKNGIASVPSETDQNKITRHRVNTTLCVLMCNNGFAAGV